MGERTLVIVKPEHIDLADVVLKELDEYGKRVKTSKVDSVPQDLAEEHYELHKNKFFYEWLVTSFANQPVVLAVYEGPDIINRISDAIGCTDPAKALPDTIRGKYSKDTQEKAIAEKRTIANVVHNSANREEAERELDVWREYL